MRIRSPWSTFLAVSCLAMLLLSACKPAPQEGASNGDPGGLPLQDTNNYAGYAVDDLEALEQLASPRPFASGTWTVPTVSCVPGYRTEVSMWLGLGGGVNAPLEQVATTSGCDVFGKPNHQANYQMLGTPEGNEAQTIDDCEGQPCPVEAGDKMAGSVIYEGAGTYYLSLKNLTRGWNYGTFHSGNSDKSAWRSAFWILEAVTRGGNIVALSNFGEATFSQCQTNFGAMGDHRITKIHRYQITPALVNPHRAVPSQLTESGLTENYRWNDFTIGWRVA